MIIICAMNAEFQNSKNKPEQLIRDEIECLGTTQKETASKLGIADSESPKSYISHLEFWKEADRQLAKVYGLPENTDTQ